MSSVTSTPRRRPVRRPRMRSSTIRSSPATPAPVRPDQRVEQADERVGGPPGRRQAGLPRSIGPPRRLTGRCVGELPVSGGRRRGPPSGGRSPAGRGSAAISAIDDAAAIRAALPRARSFRSRRSGASVASPSPHWRPRRGRTAATGRRGVVERPDEQRRVIVRRRARASSAPHTMPRSPGARAMSRQWSGPAIRSNRYEA